MTIERSSRGPDRATAPDRDQTDDDRVADTGTARDAIRTATRAAAGIGVPGLFAPGLDVSGMAAIWTTMIFRIARRRGVAMDRSMATKIAVSVVAAASAYSVGSTVLGIVLLLVAPAAPVVALPAAVAANSALNALFTYKLGVQCVERFSRPGITATDLLLTTWHLTPIPTFSELHDLRQLLSG